MQALLRERSLTADDLWEMTAGVDQTADYELDDGRLIQVTPAGPRHGQVMLRIGALLSRFLDEHPLGELVGGDAGFRLADARVRAPDVAFISREQLARTPIPERGYYPGVPDLAVEVLSPEDTLSEVLLKVSRYLESGTRLVWLVDPLRRTVAVCRPNLAVQLLGSEEKLTGADVLPGFECNVADLFRGVLDSAT